MMSGGRAELAVHALDDLEHDAAGGEVERAGRLVAQKQRRALGDGARDGHALLLAAGELRRKVILARSPSPTSASASSGAIGFSAMSVMRATFSAAVRLGMRL